MKSFIAALTVLVLVLFLTAYLTAAGSAAISALAEVLPADSETEKLPGGADAVREFSEIWEKNRFLFFISVDRQQLSETSTALAEALGAAEANDADAFQIALSKLADAFDDLSDHIRFAWERII